MTRAHLFALATLTLVLALGGPIVATGEQDTSGEQGGEAVPGAVLRISSVEATVGDHLDAMLVLQLEEEQRFEPRILGPELGAFKVVRGDWNRTEEAGDGRGETWTWTGVLATYETGERELPAIPLRVSRGASEEIVETDPVTVPIASVLSGDEDPVTEQPADIKGPASMEPDYGPVLASLAGVAALLLAAAAFWWLHRRLRSRLEAVEQPEDPFRRLSPHVWVYEELKKLLSRRLAEEGRVDEFFAELARIVKVYLGGRYRVDLMEHTTEEIPWLLGQAGSPEDVTVAAGDLLHRCDLVKFAGHAPGMDGVRSAVEEAYRIVDISKPPGAEEWPSAKGAA